MSFSYFTTTHYNPNLSANAKRSLSHIGKYGYRLIVFLICSLSLMPTACDKVPMNGDLDGMWQLMTITTPEGTRDVKNDRVYTSFQLHLVQWKKIYEDATFYSHFRHTSDSLYFYDFAHSSNHAIDDNQDEWVTPAEMNEGLLDAWGIHSIDARYRVLQLDDNALRLQQADTLLYFRKF